jgi:ATPase subunit of ABC transporter with duplicated ATPase domains
VGGKILLDGADVFLPYGRKFGLIGKNGIGKTQLLGALARDDYKGF